jgi:hypothetical protein
MWKPLREREKELDAGRKRNASGSTLFSTLGWVV